MAISMTRADLIRVSSATPAQGNTASAGPSGIQLRGGRQPATFSVSLVVSAILAATAQMRTQTALAQTSPAADANSTATTLSGDEDGGSALQEVTVTATRRAASVLSIPYNISAVSATDLKAAGVTDVQGLTSMIPGLQAPDQGVRGNQFPQLTIRGLNVSPNGQSSALPGGEAPLVSMYSDDTPLNANLKMTDLARVEVLRGPQSTLYGSGSVGGTVRLIHNEPDTTQTEFQVSANLSDTCHTHAPSGSVDTVFNLPISETIALRGSAGWEGLAGFTDALSVARLDAAQQPILANPGSPLTSGLTFERQNGVDNSTLWYARLSGLWKFSDTGRALLTYQHQQSYAGGFPYEQPGLDYQQNNYVSQWGRDRTDLVSLDVSADAGFATLSSTSSYTRQSNTYVSDLTGTIEELNPILYGNYPRVTSPGFGNDLTETYTQEIRLVSNRAGPITWVGGIWYSYQYAANDEAETIPGYAAWAALPGTGDPSGCTVFDATNCPYPTRNDVIQYANGATPLPLPGKPQDAVFYYSAQTRFHDFAPVYGEITYHVTDKWQVTGGGRIALQRFSQEIQQEIPICGPFCGSSPTDTTGSLGVSNSTSYRKEIFKANTSYALTPDTLLYYTWSQGFRRGGANGLAVGTCQFCVPASQIPYQPDLAVNNEVGIKGRLPGGSTYSVTLFNINWEHPQVSGAEPTSGQYVIGNANGARSRGVETELGIAVARGTRLLLGYSYADAKLTSSFDIASGAIVGVAGDPLPAVSKQQASASLDYIHPLKNGLVFNTRADASYRSNFWTITPHSPNAVLLPSFYLLNVRAGISSDAWSVNGYIENITNSRAATAFNYDANFSAHNYEYLVSRPRTVGIAVSYSLKGQKR